MTFREGEQVTLVEDGAIGTIDFTRQNHDPDTGRPIGEPLYDIAWEDGEYSTHAESELAALAE